MLKHAWAMLWALPLIAGGGCQIPPIPEENPAPNVVFYGVTMKYFREGDLAATGNAKQLSYERASSEVAAGAPHLHLDRSASGQIGDGGVDIWAPAGRGVLLHKQLDLAGGVTVETARLFGETPTAHYDGMQMQASGKEPVKITGSGYRLVSNGFLFDFNEELYHFDGDVRGTLGASR
jgi:hypothetical protein